MKTNHKLSLKCFAVISLRKKQAKLTAKPARKSDRMPDFGLFLFSTTFRHSLKWGIALAFVLFTALSLTKPALAFEDDTDGYIPADQTIDDDLFISAETVTIDGTVNGDVIASSERVIINGTINGNLIINSGITEINGFIDGSVAYIGQQMVLNSTINGSLYFAGVELLLNSEAQINRNILFVGISLQTLPGSVIGRDLRGTGYQAILGGFVGGKVSVDVVAAEVSGRINGDATIKVGDPDSNPPNFLWLQIWAENWGNANRPEQLSAGLRVSPEAQIQGQLTYISEGEQSDAILAEPDGGVVFEQVIGDSQSLAHLWLLARLREFLTLLALGGLAIWLIPDSVFRSGVQLRTKPGRSFGWGVLGLIGGYTGILFALIMLIMLGILLAIVTLGGLAKATFGIGLSSLVMVFSIFTLLVVYGSKVIVAYLFGDLIVSRIRSEGSNLQALALVIGVTVFVVLRFIPIVSPIVGILAAILGLGAILLAFKSRKQDMSLPEGA